MYLQHFLARLERTRRPRSRRGMTMMEIMIVITIIVLLTGVLMWGIMGTAQAAYQDSARLQIGKIEQDVVLFKMKKKRLPETLAELYKNEPAPTDPWGNPYQLEAGHGDELAVVSLGADGKPGGSGSDEDIKGSTE